MKYVIDSMVFLGSALMVYNIVCFVRFGRFVRGRKSWDRGDMILLVPTVLLVFFLAGYLFIGLFGKPDIIMAGILFGGSIFVFVMGRMLSDIVRRLTENEHLEAELLAVEEGERAKTSFLASISHEMRTPMNVILGMDTLALKNPDLSPQTRDQLEKIGYSAVHLKGLIDNLLDLQEMEAGTLIIRKEPFSMREALEQVDAVISVMCREKGLAYETSFAAGVMSHYSGDSAQLKRVLINLLDNAVKFTDAPGRVRFTVDLEKEEDTCTELRFTVSDTGIGIDEEFLPKLFLPFVQEDSSFTNRYGGTGTGLAAAHRMVTGMGGRIEAASKKGEGSTFVVILPFMPLPEEDQPEQEYGDEKEDGQLILSGCRILIVEDLAENAEIVSDLLELEGAVSVRAENGLAGVELFRKSAPYEYDAILMDLRMPVMDGLEAAKRIRAMQRPDAGSVPIIALTANAYESDIRNSLNAGMNEHLSKPIDADRLYAELNKWIHTARRE